MSMAKFDFVIEHRPGVTNAVPDTLSRQSMTNLPSAEGAYVPEEGVTSFLLLAVSADIPYHTPSLVSETANGTFAYLQPPCLLTHTLAHRAAPADIVVEPNKQLPADTTPDGDYLHA